MLAWSEELITDVRKPEIMVMTSLQAGTVAVLVFLAFIMKHKLKSTRRIVALFFPLVWMPTAEHCRENFSKVRCWRRSR